MLMRKHRTDAKKLASRLPGSELAAPPSLQIAALFAQLLQWHRQDADVGKGACVTCGGGGSATSKAGEAACSGAPDCELGELDAPTPVMLIDYSHATVPPSAVPPTLRSAGGGDAGDAGADHDRAASAGRGISVFFDVRRELRDARRAGRAPRIPASAARALAHASAGAAAALDVVVSATRHHRGGGDDGDDDVEAVAADGGDDDGTANEGESDGEGGPARVSRASAGGVPSSSLIGKGGRSIVDIGNRGSAGPHLVVVPTSTLGNWKRELNRWCAELEVGCSSGSVFGDGRAELGGR